ncbi:hypothetical protein DXG03_005479 [Asterophora parasitica]|uniref:Uncharacterized protein n=1 Tax=Asterophora parasitica TaxID=117018 RepID=A0A9P7G5S6_9AGAR|nr:hypothetical protein DXG03_005479 [Asterophora parasitica]
MTSKSAGRKSCHDPFPRVPPLSHGSTACAPTPSRPSTNPTSTPHPPPSPALSPTTPRTTPAPTTAFPPGLAQFPNGSLLSVRLTHTRFASVIEDPLGYRNTGTLGHILLTDCIPRLPTPTDPAVSQHRALPVASYHGWYKDLEDLPEPIREVGLALQAENLENVA